MRSGRRSGDFTGAADAPTQLSFPPAATSPRATCTGLWCAQKTSIRRTVNSASSMLVWPAALVGIIGIWERKHRKILSTSGHPSDPCRNAGKTYRSPTRQTAP
jgi:hypothetical protein